MIHAGFAALPGLLAVAGTLLATGSVEAQGKNALVNGKPTPAWIRFQKTEQSYKGVPYLWLGDGDILLRADVKPRPSHVLAFLWGSKGDERDAVLMVNGRRAELRHGGYDGFSWWTVPVPQGVKGAKYEMRLSRAFGSPAFLAEVRVLSPGEAGCGAYDAKKAACKMTVEVKPPTRPHPFPEMRGVWESEPAAPKDVRDPHTERLFHQAARNARRANEQFFRCRRFVDGWLAQADPKTGLIPRNLGRDRDIWNAQDAAADNYPFMVLTCALTDRPLFEGRMLDMLRTETRLTCRIGRLPDTWSFSRQAFRSDRPNLAAIIFGGSEYVKDGLLPLTEWLGPSPWSERMLGIADDLWKHAPVKTPFGQIPSTNVEVNGEMLQALSRLYWMTGNQRYLEYATRLGDYYLLGGHHPTRDFKSLRLRDHGCEIVSGLSELYAAVHFADPARKKTYREPVHAMFDRILEVGRNEDGLLYNTINPRTGETSRGLCDTWGYNYNGIYTVYLLDGTTAYREAVRKVLSNLNAHYKDFAWGGRSVLADEYADSIEGALNLYNRERIPSTAEWLDSEIKNMWRPQRPDGVVEGWHGDGNSARTAIMYALWKTQGLTVRPWRPDLLFGAVEKDGVLYVSLTAQKNWNGRLVFDRKRHTDIMHLPIDYPRINQFPEWFTVERSRRYAVRKVPPGLPAEAEYTGARMQEGIRVEVREKTEQRWIVVPSGK